MPTPAKHLLSISLIFFIIGPASAGMYRWVDENGGTVYSQIPPSSGEVVRIKPRPAPDMADQEAARERLKAAMEQSFDAEEEKKQMQEEQAKRAEQQAKRAENCKAARHNLETLQNLGPRMVRNPDGRYLRLSEDEVELKIHKAQQQVNENCD